MTDLRAKVAAEMPRALEELKQLVAIPSVSSLPERADDVRASAEWIADRLRELGCPDVRVVAADGQPAVIGRFPAPAGKPTVCLYAHHDVQPTGDPALWRTGDPFVAEERDGRLYGRGAGDDKAGVIGHLVALRAFGGKPPVGVTVFIEGEEEIGSPSLPRLIAEHHDALAADAYVILDAGNWEVGQPAITSTLRGLGELVVTLRTSDRALHSGMFGGVVPDALTSMVTLLGTLLNEDGSIAVPGLVDGTAPDLEYPEDRLRAETGILDGVRWLGTGSVVDRLWAKHSLAVLALDATPVKDASNTLYPSCRAKIGLRVPPGADAEASQQAVGDFLVAHAPFGAHVEIEYGASGQPFRATFEGEICDALWAGCREAWGREPVFAGQGGSIPLAAEFGDAFGKPVVCTAVLDPTSAMHAANESVDIAEIEKAALAEALMLASLGD